MNQQESERGTRPISAAEPIHGEPVDSWDQINKYGTYECQDTTDTDNVFPLIGPLGAGVSGVTLPDIPDAVKDKKRPGKQFE